MKTSYIEWNEPSVQQFFTCPPTTTQERGNDMVTLMTKPSCVQCDATKKQFDKFGIEYHTIDLTEDLTALEKAKNLGHLQAPVVIIDDDPHNLIHWSGFRPDKIQTFLV